MKWIGLNRVQILINPIENLRVVLEKDLGSGHSPVINTRVLLKNYMQQMILLTMQTLTDPADVCCNKS